MKVKLISVASTLLVLLIVVLISCSKSSSSNSSTPPNANSVTMAGMVFSPSNITVKSGTTITWTNNDNISHTVTADDNSFNSGTLAAGATFSHTFNTAGVIHYHCNFHSMMVATVTVN